MGIPDRGFLNSASQRGMTGTVGRQGESVTRGKPGTMKVIRCFLVEK